MKLISKILLCFILFVCANVSAKENYQFLGLGDSITTGYGISNVNNTYVEIINNYLQDNFEDKNIFVNNEAINGLTSQGLLDNIEKDISLQEKIKSADLISLSIGGNDYLTELISNFGLLNTNNTKFIELGSNLIANYKSIYDNIFKLNNEVLLIVIPLYNPYILLLKGNNELIEIFNNTKAEAVEQLYNYKHDSNKRIYTSSTLGDILEHNENLNTGIDPHPNINGHNLIAQECIKILKTEYDSLNIGNTNKETDFIFKYKYYLIILALAFIVFMIERRYNNKRK